MVIFDVGASFLLSGIMAKRFRGERPDISITASALTMAVPGLFFLERYPEWDWQYLIDPQSLPPGVYGAFTAAIIIAAILGRKVALKTPKVHWGLLGVFGIYCGIFARRTVYVGSRDQYFSDAAPFLPTEFLIHVGLAVVWAVIILGVSLMMANRSATAVPIDG